jgi:hypothetical protein
MDAMTAADYTRNVIMIGYIRRAVLEPDRRVNRFWSWIANQPVMGGRIIKDPAERN